MKTAPADADRRLAIGLAFVGGYCDAASLLLVGNFTGHVTGNFVLSATKAASGDWRGAFAALLAISLFLAGTFLSVIIAHRLVTRSARLILQVTMGVEIVLIVAAYVALTQTTFLGPKLYLVGLALAMGLQNGAVRRVNGINVHTTFVTGMITTLITGTSGAEQTSDLSTDWRVLGGIWIAFVLGALTGAVLVAQFKEVGILGAAFLLCVILRGTTHLWGQPPAGDVLMD